VSNLKKCEDDLALILPKLTTLKDKITKERKKEGGGDLIDMVDIPKDLLNDNEGNLFFRFDSGVLDTSRLVIFSSEFKDAFTKKT
jgi:hypothetical protein